MGLKKGFKMARTECHEEWNVGGGEMRIENATWDEFTKNL